MTQVRNSSFFFFTFFSRVWYLPWIHQDKCFDLAFLEEIFSFKFQLCTEWRWNKNFARRFCSKNNYRNKEITIKRIQEIRRNYYFFVGPKFSLKLNYNLYNRNKIIVRWLYNVTFVFSTHFDFFFFLAESSTKPILETTRNQ